MASGFLDGVWLLRVNQFIKRVLAPSGGFKRIECRLRRSGETYCLACLAEYKDSCFSRVQQCANAKPKAASTVATEREDGCFVGTAERKYCVRGNAFTKRSPRPKEFITNSSTKRTYHQLEGSETRPSSAKGAPRKRSSRAALHPRAHFPNGYCDFEDDTVYLICQRIDGVNMSDLEDEAREAVVQAEPEEDRAKLKTLESKRLGGPSGIVIPPHRVLHITERDDWSCCEESEAKDGNRRSGICRRKGPSVALREERDDSLEVLGFLTSKVGKMQDAGEDSGAAGRTRCGQWVTGRSATK
ncbi:hypothetical protein QBC40DRAFT_319838 [Triangularia verruculosa]|uniref:Uncharacterized protein n=1 Tax=Triangularia verruculosa TaxID=2587418 RepID=A0AAN7AQ57_9PEZI|nr:hypothetical protein QBC40DRAFT_319838 [Triangularia verruculosa]